MFKLVKYFFFLVCMALLIAFISCVFAYQKLRYSTPSLSDLAQNLDTFPVGVGFNYSKNINEQLYLLSKNIGLEDNNFVKSKESTEGNIGANGFFVFDVRLNDSQALFVKLDNLLNDALDFLDTASISNDDIEKKFIVDETENNSIASSPFITPLASLLEEIWNGKTFVFGGATQFHLSIKDSFMLALDPYIKNYMELNSNFFRKMIIRNVPLYLQDFLNKHSINVDIEPAIMQLDDSIHESQIILSIADFSDFLDSICSVKIDPKDFCARFSMNRSKFRRNAQSLLGLISQDFKVTLNVFWAIRGKDIIYANQKDLVLALINDKGAKKSSNIFTEVAASGDDFLFGGHNNLKYTRLSIYFDMIKTQNECINFFENLRKRSQVASDYFSSPNGSIAFAGVEKKINELTLFSQKASLAIHTDGGQIFPELRLYSPSMDLFINEGEQLSPEFINALRVFITKAVSFGDFLLPRGLVPIPGPFLNRNGRWVILKSQISVKSIAPYLENIDPFIDKHDMPSPL